MTRVLFAAVVTALVAIPTSAEEPKPKPKLTVDLSGSIADEKLQKLMPANGVIVSQKGWEKLAKVWGIKEVPKVDFTKEILIVGTWKGSSFDINAGIKDGDLTVSGFGTKDLRPGFRWKIKSISREGIKTVQGKELPKE
ncbi:MAG: hypothetical protein L0241_28425 [Planctomycetia bacterium]|nr:hypothetical protein [Planctomycetia bacterium]